MYTVVFVDRNFSTELALWFFEFINVILIIIASIMMYSSVSIISKNVNEKNDRLFKLTRALILTFIVLFSVSTIFTLILHILNYQSVFSFGKNMIAYLLLAGFLLGWNLLLFNGGIPLAVTLSTVFTVYVVGLVPILVASVVPSWRNAITEPDIVLRGV